MTKNLIQTTPSNYFIVKANIPGQSIVMETIVKHFKSSLNDHTLVGELPLSIVK